ncbi:MAG: Mrp/NBP35 family ATP-binding protein [Phycisphaerales bacterium]
MGLTKDNVRAALSSVAGVAGESVVASGALLWTSVCDTYASIKLEAVGAASKSDLEAVAKRCWNAVSQLAAKEGTQLDSFVVEFVDHGGKVVHQVGAGWSSATWNGGASNSPSKPNTPPTPTTSNPSSSGGGGGGHTPIGGLRQQPTPQQNSNPLPNVRHIIAVGAGKGGVGKSTIALNIAVGLARRGYSVGLLDGDIYGPSVPTMLNLASMEAMVHQGMLQPFLTHGIKAMTIGKLVDADKPLIWRGPMAHGAFKQLTEQTEWGELDFLIIDLPPGTGDVSLTLAQTLKLTGAVVVCTPQKVAQDDAVRAAKMFQQLGIPVLGVVENMSGFVADDGKHYDIFGRGGAEQMAQRLNVPFLGAIPITMALRANSDTGNPTANFESSDAPGKRLVASLEQMLTNLEGQIALSGMKEKRPTLSIS